LQTVSSRSSPFHNKPLLRFVAICSPDTQQRERERKREKEREREESTEEKLEGPERV
jgi:hypothetical protein